MKFYFDGPMCFITEVGANKKKVNILVPRLVKDGGDFRMNLSDPQPEDNIHWISVYISKKNSNGEKVIKPVHIECNNYEEVISLADSLQVRYGALIKQFRIEKRKPWLKAHRQMVEHESKAVSPVSVDTKSEETVNEIS